MSEEQSARNRRYSIVLGQRATWPEMLARTREVEELGFDGLFLVDHFYGLVDVDDPTHEAYTMLAALAPFTQRLRLGVMVCGNTYRNPAFLLKQAITVDHVSNGRVDFGVGAGWVEREHEAYGFDFPTAGVRVDRFAEALEIWDLLQRQERTTFEGEHYTLIDAPFAPKPVQSPKLPVLIGGSGPRMLRLTARHADIWNGIGTPDEGRALNDRLDEACRAEGRDPATLVRGVSPSLNLLSSVDAFADGVAAYHDAGFRDVYLPWSRTPAELPVLRAVAREILPGLRGGAVRPAGVATSPSLRPLDDDGAMRLWARLPDGTERRLLAALIDRPDQRLDGTTLRALLDLERHSDVARGMASIAALAAELGYARPWNEGQRGYLLPADAATVLRTAAGSNR